MTYGIVLGLPVKRSELSQPKALDVHNKRGYPKPIMNPFSRSDWKRSTRRGGKGWELAGAVVLLLILVAIIKALAGW